MNGILPGELWPSIYTSCRWCILHPSPIRHCCYIVPDTSTRTPVTTSFCTYPSKYENIMSMSSPHSLTPSQDATQRSEGSPPATDPLQRPTSAAESRGMHAQQQRELQSHQPARLQQLGTSGPPRPSSSSPPQQMRASTDETFGVGEAFGGNGRAGAIHSAEEEEQSCRQTLQLQPQRSSPSPGEIFRAEAGGVDAQQRVQVCKRVSRKYYEWLRTYSYVQC